MHKKWITKSIAGISMKVKNASELSLKIQTETFPIHGRKSLRPSHDLRAAFSETDGTLSGIFTHPGNDTAVSFIGVAYQKTNSASGYFIYVLTANAPVESGAVGVTKK